MKKTKTQELGITEFPYVEKNKNGSMTYYEDSSGYWVNLKHNDKYVLTYIEYYDGDKVYII